MNIVFRVDASNLMGTGHLMRCLTLAEALRDRGATPRFICRYHPGNLIAHLRQRAFPVAALHSVAVPEPNNASGYASWLGLPQEQDADETIDALGSERSGWLVVDHYGLDKLWERRLRPHVDRLLVIDDLANRHHDCDLLLDQNFVANAQTRYQGLVPSGCRMLIGPHYALLRPEYAMWRQHRLERKGNVRRILVFMGGSDLHNMTGLVLRVLSKPEFKGLEIDVVAGVNNPHLSEIQSLVTQLPHATLHQQRPHLADLMAKADLSIGAGGTTNWERLCFGLPTIGVSVAENQRTICEALQQAGLIRYAGDAKKIDQLKLHSLLWEMVNNSFLRVALSEAASLHVDGLGTLRVLEAIFPSSVEQLWLRAARSDDVTLYFNWVNDPEVRRQAINSNIITWQAHKAWFSKKISAPHAHLFVLKANKLPVGQIRFDLKQNEALIDYSLDSLVRRRGWAIPLVSLGIREFWKIKRLPLRADVKSNNDASLSVFRQLGFSEFASTNDPRMKIFYMDVDKFSLSI